MSKHSLLLGAHMSIAGGFEKSLERGASIGCTTIQIFTKSNRQWNAKKITSEQAQTFKEAVQQYSINPIVVHATYLINIGSPDTGTMQKSTAALIDELERCHVLGIPYLVLHPGSHTGTDIDACLIRIATQLDQALQQATGNTMILLENMAGQGSTVCYSLEQLATIYKNTEHKKRIGFCLDTCHAFAAGYDFNTHASYRAFWETFELHIGIKNLKAIHINDSKKELNSRVDRHEDIGKGKIGLEAFRLLFNDELLFNIPKILETPEGDLESYARNMRVIRDLISPETRLKLGL